jgi:2-oxoglutarate dehydrogenase E2 component (dihydrolipoamide succinyltransferase)
MADSITQGTLASWEKSTPAVAIVSHSSCLIEVGEYVKQDETVASIETDKVTIPVNAPESGIIKKHFAGAGDTVDVGSDLFAIEPKVLSENVSVKSGKESGSESAKKSLFESTNKGTEATTKSIGTTSRSIETPKQSVAESQKKSGEVKSWLFEQTKAVRGEQREKMTRMRMRIAERMKESQNIAASLTTFNEVDMSSLVNLRLKYKEAFVKKHEGVKLGFMSAFVKACAVALEEVPVVNARIENGDTIVYNEHVDISVAVATSKVLPSSLYLIFC